MATLNERLAEAESAYHQLMVGTAVVRIRDANGEEVTFSRADRSALKAYIDDLKQQISGIATTYRPMRVFF